MSIPLPTTYLAKQERHSSPVKEKIILLEERLKNLDVNISKEKEGKLKYLFVNLQDIQNQLQKLETTHNEFIKTLQDKISNVGEELNNNKERREGEDEKLENNVLNIEKENIDNIDNNSVVFLFFFFYFK
jgi:hypothetical protein